MKSTYGTMYYVDDMNESVEFFSTILDGKPVFTSDDWSEFDCQGHKLCLHSKAPDQLDYPENGVLIFNHDGINEFHKKMKADGYKVLPVHNIHPGASTFNFKDENENEFSFYGTP